MPAHLCCVGQGLFFYHTKKVGLGVGVKWGAGVLVTHILDEDGKESWSAPVLYKVHEVSLGLLAGAVTSSSLLFSFCTDRLLQA